MFLLLYRREFYFARPEEKYVLRVSEKRAMRIRASALCTTIQLGRLNKGAVGRAGRGARVGK
jgi:hypothetical protein